MLNYFNSKLITYIPEIYTKNEILELMVNQIKKNTDILIDEKSFYSSILEREELGSTGIGQGIAIPHIRSEKINKIVVAIALLENPIDFKSVDGEKVKLIILVGAPRGCNEEYLSLISQLMRTFRNNKMRENILSATDYQELLEGIAQIK